MPGTVESCSATALNINIRVHAAVTVDNFDSSDNLCFRIVSAVLCQYEEGKIFGQKII